MRCTFDQREALEHQAREAGLELAEFLRLTLFGEKPIAPKARKDTAAVIAACARLGNLANQNTHAANRLALFDSAHPQQTADLLRQLERDSRAMREMIESIVRLDMAA